MNSIKNSLLVVLLACFLWSCEQNQEARRPLSQASGSFMKKSIEFNLVPDENKLYNAKMFKDNSLFKEEKVDAETMKYYMLQKMSEKELANLRTAVKLFKTKKIKLYLKEQN